MHKVLSLLAGIGMLLNPIQPLQTHPQHIVCVDPGHGETDPGAMNADLSEAEETLDIAYNLKSLLESKNYKVVMTRSDNSTNPTNSERAEVCNHAHADLLVSIHLNSSTDPSLDYTQALYGSPQKDKKLAQSMHAVLISELDIPSPDNDGVTDFHDNLLLKANMPATLQETVFISDSDEYTKLTDGSETRQKQIAQALFDGINKWFNQQKSNQS